MDNVAYIVRCYCHETIYAAWDRVDRRIKYWPELYWSDCMDPITHCRGCGRSIKEVEDQQYDEAMEYLP